MGHRDRDHCGRRGHPLRPHKAIRPADVVIVGGGIIGLSIAHALTQRGVSHVVVLERARCGQGSTAKATGGIRCQFSSELNVRMSLLSLEYFRNWADLFGGDVGYQAHGYMFLATNDIQFELLKQGAAMQVSLGAKTELLTPAEIASRIPALNTEGITGGTFGVQDGRGDPGGAVVSLIGACRRGGVTILEQCAVTGFGLADGRISGVESSCGAFAADIVVNAAGAWSDPVARLAGTSVPVSPHHRQAYLAGEVQGVPTPSPHVIDLGTGCYFHQESHGLVFGGGDRESEPGYDDQIWPNDAPRIMALLTHRLPSSRDVPLKSIWAGLREMTPDDIGIVGFSPELSNLFIAAGFSGHGFMHAPAVGEVSARLMTGADALFDVSALDPARFRHQVAHERYVV